MGHDGARACVHQAGEPAGSNLIVGSLEVSVHCFNDKENCIKHLACVLPQLLKDVSVSRARKRTSFMSDGAAVLKKTCRQCLRL